MSEVTEVGLRNNKGKERKYYINLVPYYTKVNAPSHRPVTADFLVWLYVCYVEFVVSEMAQPEYSLQTLLPSAVSIVQSVRFVRLFLTSTLTSRTSGRKLETFQFLLLCERGWQPNLSREDVPHRKFTTR